MDIEVLKVVHQLETAWRQSQLDLECSQRKVADHEEVIRKLGFQIRNLQSVLNQSWWSLGRLVQLPDAARGVVELARQKGILQQEKK